MKKVALITGASRGIGAATAKLLAENGYAVCVNYHTAQDKAEALVKAIQQSGGQAIAIKADMSAEKDIIQLFASVERELGCITALVNNAGINGGMSEVENITSECLQSVFATNVFGTFIACREAIKHMKKQGHGNIVNISSEAAKFGGNRLAHYAASKAAINTFTVGFAREVAPYHIRVNTVSPGVIDTDQHVSVPADRIANLIKSIPIGRMGTITEVAQLILWLLSDHSSYVSGAIIPITGSR
jgi:NAD(P)-dependent dehydrogenase (short-subunit alcohol dehydrogenase family)